MSLRTVYNLSTTISAAYQAGIDYVGTEAIPGEAYANLSAGLLDAASKGKESFTISPVVTHAPETLKLLNKYWDAFKSGIISALAVEGIMSYEVTLALNTSDTNETTVDFTFSF